MSVLIKTKTTKDSTNIKNSSFIVDNYVSTDGVVLSTIILKFGFDIIDSVNNNILKITKINSIKLSNDRTFETYNTVEYEDIYMGYSYSVSPSDYGQVTTPSGSVLLENDYIEFSNWTIAGSGGFTNVYIKLNLEIKNLDESVNYGNYEYPTVNFIFDGITWRTQPPLVINKPQILAINIDWDNEQYTGENTTWIFPESDSETGIDKNGISRYLATVLDIRKGTTTRQTSADNFKISDIATVSSLTYPITSMNSYVYIYDPTTDTTTGAYVNVMDKDVIEEINNYGSKSVVSDITNPVIVEDYAKDICYSMSFAIKDFPSDVGLYILSKLKPIESIFSPGVTGSEVSVLIYAANNNGTITLTQGTKSIVANLQQDALTAIRRNSYGGSIEILISQSKETILECYFTSNYYSSQENPTSFLLLKTIIETPSFLQTATSFAGISSFSTSSSTNYEIYFLENTIVLGKFMLDADIGMAKQDYLSNTVYPAILTPVLWSNNIGEEKEWKFYYKDNSYRPYWTGSTSPSKINLMAPADFVDYSVSEFQNHFYSSFSDRVRINWKVDHTSGEFYIVLCSQKSDISPTQTLECSAANLSTDLFKINYSNLLKSKEEIIINSTQLPTTSPQIVNNETYKVEPNTLDTSNFKLYQLNGTSFIDITGDTNGSFNIKRKLYSSPMRVWVDEDYVGSYIRRFENIIVIVFNKEAQSIELIQKTQDNNIINKKLAKYSIAQSTDIYSLLVSCDEGKDNLTNGTWLVLTKQDNLGNSTQLFETQTTFSFSPATGGMGLYVGYGTRSEKPTNIPWLSCWFSETGDTIFSNYTSSLSGGDVVQFTEETGGSLPANILKLHNYTVNNVSTTENTFQLVDDNDSVITVSSTSGYALFRIRPANGNADIYQFEMYGLPHNQHIMDYHTNNYRHFTKGHSGNVISKHFLGQNALSINVNKSEEYYYSANETKVYLAQKITTTQFVSSGLTFFKDQIPIRLLEIQAKTSVQDMAPPVMRARLYTDNNDVPAVALTDWITSRIMPYNTLVQFDLESQAINASPSAPVAFWCVLELPEQSSLLSLNNDVIGEFNYVLPLDNITLSATGSDALIGSFSLDSTYLGSWIPIVISSGVVGGTFLSSALNMKIYYGSGLSQNIIEDNYIYDFDIANYNKLYFFAPSDIYNYNILLTSVNTVSGNISELINNVFVGRNIILTKDIWCKLFSSYAEKHNNVYDGAIVQFKVAAESQINNWQSLPAVPDIRTTPFSLPAIVDIVPPAATGMTKPVLTINESDVGRQSVVTVEANDSGSGIKAFRIIYQINNTKTVFTEWIPWEYSSSYRVFYLGGILYSNFGQNSNGQYKVWAQVIDNVGNLSESEHKIVNVNTVVIVDTSAPDGRVQIVDTNSYLQPDITNQTNVFLNSLGYDEQTDVKDIRYRQILSSGTTWSPWFKFNNYILLNLVNQGLNRFEIQLRDYGNNIINKGNVWSTIKNNIVLTAGCEYNNLIYVCGITSEKYENYSLVDSESSSYLTNQAFIPTSVYGKIIRIKDTDRVSYVSVNGVNTSEYTIDSENGFVVMTTPATAGSSLFITFQRETNSLYRWTTQNIYKEIDITHYFGEKAILAMTPITYTQNEVDYSLILLGGQTGKVYTYDGRIMKFTSFVIPGGYPITSMFIFRFQHETDDYVYVGTSRMARLYRTKVQNAAQGIGWEQVGGSISCLSSSTSGDINDINATFDSLYLATNDSIIKYNRFYDGTETEVASVYILGDNVTSLAVTHQQILASLDNSNFIYSSDLNLIHHPYKTEDVITVNFDESFLENTGEWSYFSDGSTIAHDDSNLLLQKINNPNSEDNLMPMLIINSENASTKFFESNINSKWYTFVNGKQNWYITLNMMKIDFNVNNAVQGMRIKDGRYAINLALSDNIVYIRSGDNYAQATYAKTPSVFEILNTNLGVQALSVVSDTMQQGPGITGPNKGIIKLWNYGTNDIDNTGPYWTTTGNPGFMAIGDSYQGWAADRFVSDFEVVNSQELKITTIAGGGARIIWKHSEQEDAEPFSINSSSEILVRIKVSSNDSLYKSKLKVAFSNSVNENWDNIYWSSVDISVNNLDNYYTYIIKPSWHGIVRSAAIEFENIPGSIIYIDYVAIVSELVVSNIRHHFVPVRVAASDANVKVWIGNQEHPIISRDNFLVEQTSDKSIAFGKVFYYKQEYDETAPAQSVVEDSNWAYSSLYFKTSANIISNNMPVKAQFSNFVPRWQIYSTIGVHKLINYKNTVWAITKATSGNQYYNSSEQNYIKTFSIQLFDNYIKEELQKLPLNPINNDLIKITEPNFAIRADNSILIS